MSHVHFEAVAGSPASSIVEAGGLNSTWNRPRHPACFAESSEVSSIRSVVDPTRSNSGRVHRIVPTEGLSRVSRDPARPSRPAGAGVDIAAGAPAGLFIELGVGGAGQSQSQNQTEKQSGKSCAFHFSVPLFLLFS